MYYPNPVSSQAPQAPLFSSSSAPAPVQGQSNVASVAAPVLVAQPVPQYEGEVALQFRFSFPVPVAPEGRRGAAAVAVPANLTSADCDKAIKILTDCRTIVGKMLPKPEVAAPAPSRSSGVAGLDILANMAAASSRSSSTYVDNSVRFGGDYSRHTTVVNNAPSKDDEKSKDKGMDNGTRVIIGLVFTVFAAIGAYFAGKQAVKSLELEEQTVEFKEKVHFPMAQLPAGNDEYQADVRSILNGAGKVLTTAQTKNRTFKILLGVGIGACAFGIAGVALNVSGLVVTAFVAIAAVGVYSIYKYQLVSYADKKSKETAEAVIAKCDNTVRYLTAYKASLAQIEMGAGELPTYASIFGGEY